MRATHVGGQSASLSLPIRMLICSRNILTNSPRIMRHHLVPCGLVELTHKINHQKTLSLPRHLEQDASLICRSSGPCHPDLSSQLLLSLLRSPHGCLRVSAGVCRLFLDRCRMYSCPQGLCTHFASASSAASLLLHLSPYPSAMWRVVFFLSLCIEMSHSLRLFPVNPSQHFSCFPAASCSPSLLYFFPHSLLSFSNMHPHLSCFLSDSSNQKVSSVRRGPIF